MHPQQQQQMNLMGWQRLQQEEAWRRALEQNSLSNLMSLQSHHETSQAALGLLYDYYHQQQQVQPQRKPAQQAVKQQASPVLVKSEPLDSGFESQKKVDLKKTDLADVKKEATGSPNSGLPENYKGYVNLVWLELIDNWHFREYFEYSMEAPRSLKQKEGEPTMSYINKGKISKLKSGGGNLTSVFLIKCSMRLSP